MITAKEAKKVSKESHFDILENEIKKIESGIKHASESKLTSYLWLVSSRIDKKNFISIVDTLTKNGYEVDYTPPYKPNFPWATIKW